MKSSSIKLAAYSAAAFSFIVSNHASGQTYGLDFDPDPSLDPVLAFGTLDNISLDLDFDGTIDILFHQETDIDYGTSCGTITTSTTFELHYLGEVQFGHRVLSYTPWGPYTRIAYLPAGIPISDSVYWGSGNSVLGIATDSTFVAWRLPRLTDTLYGWMLLEVDNIGPANFTLFDYAYQIGSPTSFATGDTTGYIPLTPLAGPPSVDSLVAFDPANCYASSFFGPPIGCSFNSIHGSLVDEYHLIIIPVADSAGFDLTAAQALLSSQYKTIYPSMEAVNFSSTTIFGITEVYEEYAVYVHLVGKDFFGIPDQLFFSNVVVPTSGEFIPAGVTSLTGVNLMVPGSTPSENLKINFEPINEDCTEEYKIFVVPEAAAILPDSALIAGLLSNEVETRFPDGSALYSVYFSSNRDVLGNALLYGVSYIIYVASINTTDDIITLNSTLFTVTPAPKLFLDEVKFIIWRAGADRQIEIYNLLGQQVFAGEITGSQDIDHLPKGVYIAVHTQEGKQESYMLNLK